MDIRDMHYDFKLKHNKVDSQKNRNLLVPEIDWYLNSAAELFTALIAEPRLKDRFSKIANGFEVSQRTTEDIRSVVVNSNTLVPSAGVVTLPTDYKFWVRGYANITKGGCTATARLMRQQHDDMPEESPFNKSSFEWREVNAMFEAGGLVVTASDFTINSVRITYIRKMAYMHNAQDFGSGGTYELPSGVVLTGFANCELPAHTHPEIVDIAVLLASVGVQASDYQQKLNKLNITQLF